MFTCQNGIQNNLTDFRKMCESVTTKLHPERPLFIGLHNPTSGIVKDLERLLNETIYNTYSFLFTRQMFLTLARLLDNINPSLLWAHVAHSEGGLIARDCLTDPILGISQKYRRLMKNHLVTLIYGGVASIPDESGHERINTYSNKDIALKLVDHLLDKQLMPDTTLQEKELLKKAQEIHAYLSKTGGKWKALTVEEIAARLKKGQDEFLSQFFIKEYPHISKKRGYTITIVDSISKDLPLIEGDHGFIKDTYQNVLKENIEYLRDKIKIYDAKKEF